MQIGDLEQELVWSLLAKPPVPPPEAKSHQAPDSGLFESSGTRGYTAGGPLSEKWSEIFPQEQSRRGLRMDDKSWTSYLRYGCCVCTSLTPCCPLAPTHVPHLLTSMYPTCLTYCILPA